MIREEDEHVPDITAGTHRVYLHFTSLVPSLYIWIGVSFALTRSLAWISDDLQVDLELNSGFVPVAHHQHSTVDV